MLSHAKRCISRITFVSPQRVYLKSKTGSTWVACLLHGFVSMCLLKPVTPTFICSYFVLRRGDSWQRQNTMYNKKDS